MPSQVRIIAGTRNKAFDDFIADVIGRGAWRKEHTYFGIEDAERADHVRRKLRTAGQHHDVSVKAYYAECAGCKDGGPGCRFHVLYTVYDKAEARRYKEGQAAQQRRR